MRRLAILIVAAASLAAGGGASRAQPYQTIFIPGNPGPQAHKPRPPIPDAVQGDLHRDPLIADGAAPVTTVGPLQTGQAFLSVGVRHGLTGVLARPVAAKGWFTGGKKLPAGTPVYGVPMGGPDGPAVVWCAPRLAKQKDGAMRWSAICLPYGDAAHVWAEAHPALFPARLSWDDTSANGADPPEVTQGPVDFPAMTFSYAFGGLNTNGWPIVEVRIDWGEGPQAIRAIALPPGPDGLTHVKVLGGEFTLRPIAPATPEAVAQAEVALRGAPSATAPIVF